MMMIMMKALCECVPAAAVVVTTKTKEEHIYISLIKFNKIKEGQSDQGTFITYLIASRTDNLTRGHYRVSHKI